MLENLLLQSISTFTKLIRKRIKTYRESFLFLSQESLMTLLYIHSLICHDSKLIDRVFLDYPFMKQGGSRGKFDIYIDVGPGHYIEVKYIRPIPSGMNLPLPQHRGSLINDVIRLAFKTPTGSRKYLLLIANREFITHISNKPGFPLHEETWYGKIRDLIVTITEENRITKENRTYLDQKVKLQFLKHELALPLHIVLWKITKN